MCEFYGYVRGAAMKRYLDWHPHNELIDMIYIEIAYLVCQRFETLTITRSQLFRGKDGLVKEDKLMNIAWHNELITKGRAKGNTNDLTIREAIAQIIQHDDRIRQHIQLIEETSDAVSYRIIPVPQNG